MKIKWGIIGCGNVTERKSGPAFYTLKNSSLVAVMRRVREKARDYAQRHKVPGYYDNAVDLINDPEVDAVYVATPPDTHAHYSIMAMQAGKPVYVEKPMARTYSECLDMMEVSKQTGVPLFVAYYRRAQRYFRRLKEIIESGVLGDIRFVVIKLVKPPRPEDKLQPLPWRLKPEISGGGYFVDVGSHQIDLLLWLFGEMQLQYATVSNLGKLYDVEDFVHVHLSAESGIKVIGTWCFCGPANVNVDTVEILGSKGKLLFSTFSYMPVELDLVNTPKQVLELQKPMIAQMEMIQTVNDALKGIPGNTNYDLNSAMRTTAIIEEVYRKSKL